MNTSALASLYIYIYIHTYTFKISIMIGYPWYLKKCRELKGDIMIVWWLLNHIVLASFYQSIIFVFEVFKTMRLVITLSCNILTFEFIIGGPKVSHGRTWVAALPSTTYFWCNLDELKEKVKIKTARSFQGLNLPQSILNSPIGVGGKLAWATLIF